MFNERTRRFGTTQYLVQVFHRVRIGPVCILGGMAEDSSASLPSVSPFGGEAVKPFGATHQAQRRT